MGAGDALMAAGVAARLHAADSHPRVIVSESGKIRWNPLWLGNPAVAVPDSRAARRWGVRLVFGPDTLPYRVYPNLHSGVWRFSPTWRVNDHRPTLYFTAKELAWAATARLAHPAYLLIEPPARDRKPANRSMPLTRFAALAARLVRDSPIPVVQLAHPMTTVFPGVAPVFHADFRQAAQIVAGATLSLLPEGGLAHAAAATHAPAIVLWGGWGPVAALSYDDHLNIAAPGDDAGCGVMADCAHCAQIWASDTFDPDRIADLTLAQLSVSPCGSTVGQSAGAPPA